MRYVRAIPSRVVEMPGSKDLRLRYFDDEGAEQAGGLRPGGALGRPEAGRRAPPTSREHLGIERNEFGFCETDRLTPVVSSRPGVFVAGAFQEPKDIPESVAQASAAAAAAMELLRDGRGTLVQPPRVPAGSAT